MRNSRIRLFGCRPRYVRHVPSGSVLVGVAREGLPFVFLASSATRSSFVEMVGEPCVSPIVPPSGSDSSRCRPLLRRVPRVGSPTSSLVLRHSDFSRPLRCSLSSHRRSQLLAGGRETSQVPGQPLPPCHDLRPRWSQSAEVRGLTPPRALVSPSAFGSASASTTLTISGLNPTAQRPTVYASRPPSRVSAQDSLPVGGLGLLRSGLSPAGCFPEFQVAIPSSLASLGLAHLNDRFQASPWPRV